MGFEGEVTGIEEVRIDIFQVAVIGGGAFGRKDEIIFAPDDEGRRLIFAEEGLEIGIERDVGAVVENREVEIECLPDDIPEEFVVDVSELMIGQSVRACEIPLGANVI